MPVIQIVPTKSVDHPVPYDLSDETGSTFMEEVAIAANTVELQVDMGAPIEKGLDWCEEDEQKLLEAAIKSKKVTALHQPNTAFAAAAFLRTYGQLLALDVATARAAITHKLMEIANCGDTKFELKALELLGKHSDIGIFTDRSEITINYKDPLALEDAIKERIKRLLNADITDVTPINMDLDETLGRAGVKEEEVGLASELDL